MVESIGPMVEILKRYDFDFCINGLVWPDRTPHPSMYEFKKLVQPISIEILDAEQGKIKITNEQYFTDLSSYGKMSI